MSKNNRKNKDRVSKIAGDQRVMAGLISLVLAFGLWAFITMSKKYSYVFTQEIDFFDSEDGSRRFSCSESIISINTEATGMDIFFHKRKKKNRIVFDINDFDIDSYRSQISINSNLLKPSIAEHSRLNVNSFTISPEVVRLRTHKLDQKEVRVVSRVDFEYKKSFYSIDKPKLYTKTLVIEGRKSDLDKIDEVYTKEMTLTDIDKRQIFIIPIQDLDPSLEIRYSSRNVMIGIEPLQFTEIKLEFEIDTKNDTYSNIEVFPPKALVRFRVPVEDYGRIDFSQYSLRLKGEFGKDNIVGIGFDTLPNNIKIMDIEPNEVEYLIYKKR